MENRTSSDKLSELADFSRTLGDSAESDAARGTVRLSVDGDSGSGSGSPNDSGTSGTGSRRGRPPGSRNKTSEGVQSLRVDKPTRKRNQKGVSETEISIGISALCNLAAIVRGPHWVKTPDQCLVVGQPLAQYLDMKPETAKKVGEAFLPLALCIGLVSLFADPIRTEIALAERKKHAKGNDRLADANRTEAGEYRVSDLLGADSPRASHNGSDIRPDGGGYKAGDGLAGTNTLD